MKIIFYNFKFFVKIFYNTFLKLNLQNFIVFSDKSYIIYS